MALAGNSTKPGLLARKATEMQDIKHTLYKIYYSHGLVYIGMTNQRLNSRLRGHFFKTPMMRNIDIEAVARIECVEVPTKADMLVQEIYLINKFKPPINGDRRARDDLTFELPPLDFQPYECKLMEKWKSQITERDRAHGKRTAEQRVKDEAKGMLKIQRRNSEITEDEYWERRERIN